LPVQKTPTVGTSGRGVWCEHGGTNWEVTVVTLSSNEIG
jgi:hypothetical protein